MKRILTIIFYLFTHLLFSQKSNLYQIFADDINQQTFEEHKTNFIQREVYFYDTLSGNVKQKSSILIKFNPSKKLGKTCNKFLKTVSYWKTDTNGVNDFNYGKRGKIIEKDSSIKIFYSNGKISSIYSTLMFYNSDNKVIKTTLDTIHSNMLRGSCVDCYYKYNGDTVKNISCYFFFYNGKYTNRADTLWVTSGNKNEITTVRKINGKNRIIQNIKQSHTENESVSETYINNKLSDKTITIYSRKKKKAST